MTLIIYGQNLADKSGQGFSNKRLQETFAKAAAHFRALQDAGKRVACFFMDPLLDYFEAGNRWYFQFLGCKNITRMNWYRTGAGPVCAVADAKQLIDNDLYDAVFLFGLEPLLFAKKSKGREVVQQAMDIFFGVSLLTCYNGLAEQLCRLYGLTTNDHAKLADALFHNYARTWRREDNENTEPPPRGRFMDDAGAPLFKLTDCANPNLDYGGGIILANKASADMLNIPEAERIGVMYAAYSMVQADPLQLTAITGTREQPFPHLRAVFARMASATGLILPAVHAQGALLLDAYTCYPPIPMGFLLAGGFIKHLKELPTFLEKHEITVNGGLNLYGAPWNNPVLSSLVTMRRRLIRQGGLGLVHGNGGMGEAQGLILLQRK